MIRALEANDAGLLHSLLHQHNERALEVYLKLLAVRG